MAQSRLDGLDLDHVIMIVHWTGALLGLVSAMLVSVMAAQALLSQRPGRRPGGSERLQALGMLALLLVFASAGGLAVLRMDQWCASDAPWLRLGPVCLTPTMDLKIVLFAGLVGIQLLVESTLLPLLRRPRPVIVLLTACELAAVSTVAAAAIIGWMTVIAVSMLSQPSASQPVDAAFGVVQIAGIAWVLLAAAAAATLIVWRWRLQTVAVPDATSQLSRNTSDAASAPILIHGGRTSAPLAGNDTPLGVLQQARRGVLPGRVALVSAGPSIGTPQRSDARQRHRIVEASDREPPAIAATRVVRSALIGTFFISFVINALMLTGPLYMLQVYDRVLTSRSSETLVVLTVLIVGLYALMGLFDLIRSRILARVAIRLDSILASPLLETAVSVAPQGSRGGKPSAMRDLEQIRQFLAGPAVPAMLDLPWAPLYFALIFLLHPVLGLLALAGAAVLVVLSILNQALTRGALAQSTETMARCDGMVEAGWRGAETLRALGMMQAFSSRWLKSHAEALSAHLRAGDAGGTIATATRVARMLLQSLLLGAGAWLALHDAVSAGAMIAASIIATRALSPIEMIVAYWRSIGTAATAVKRCRAHLANAPAVDRSIELPPPRGQLTVSGLFVSPIGSTQPVLKGVSFKLEPGDALAVIGPSAAGKSTLARALVGAWPARSGDVRIDGAALTQWPADALGQHIGYLPQDALLFDGTIGENIARLEPDPDPIAVVAAARAAGVHEMILRMEQGYATRVGEGGSALPGGQRQRIALARALYGNPVLVVMDEPNANLDAAGETALIEAIGLLRAARRTVVVMAHRRNVLTACNRVLVLNEGRQSAFGPPEKVLKSERIADKEATHGHRIA